MCSVRWLLLLRMVARMVYEEGGELGPFFTCVVYFFRCLHGSIYSYGPAEADP